MYCESLQACDVCRDEQFFPKTQADAQLRRDLADRFEGLEVVAELRADLRRRDAEVSALCDLANADAALLGEQGRACMVDVLDLH